MIHWNICSFNITVTVQKYPSLPFYEHAFENFKNPYLNKFLVNLRDLFFILFVWAVCICGSGRAAQISSRSLLKTEIRSESDNFESSK